MAFPAFTFAATCPKCGEIHIAKRYVFAVEQAGIPEHMQRTCTGCSYQWDEALPTDQQKQAVAQAATTPLSVTVLP